MAHNRDDVTVVDSPPEPRTNHNDITISPPASARPAFDPEPYQIANVVAKGDACWVNAGPKGGPTPPCWAMPKADEIASHDGITLTSDTGHSASAPATLSSAEGGMTLDSTEGHSGITFVDDDGTVLEPLSVWDARRKAEHLARVRALMTNNPFLPAKGVHTADNPAKGITTNDPLPPCCDSDEILPCSACVGDQPAPAELPVTRVPEDADATEHDADHLANEARIGVTTSYQSSGVVVAPCPMCQGSPTGCAACDRTGRMDDAPAASIREIMEGMDWEAQSNGEGPLAHATPECFAAVAEGRAEFAREHGWVPFPAHATPENAADLLADEAAEMGFASRPSGWFHELVNAAWPDVTETPSGDVGETPLADLVDDFGLHCRGKGGPVAAFVAEQLAALAYRIRLVEAKTVEDFLDRESTLEAEAREAWFNQGLQEGKAAARGQMAYA